MARGKKKESALTPEEKLAQALVPVGEQPYKVPENWCWTKIGAISDFERGITFPASAKETEPTEENIPCLRTANVQENLEIDDLIYVNRSFIKGNDAKLVRKDDIIMSSANSRELVGKASFVTHVPFPMTFGGFVLNIRARGISSKYLFYFLRQEFLAGKFMGESTQTTNIANINTTTLGGYELPLPPLAEQQRIVDRIEDLFAKLDEAKEKAQSVLDSFETRKAAILHKAFTGELTAKWRAEHGIGLANWMTQTIGDIIKVSSGKALTAKNMAPDGKIPVYGGNGVTGYHNESNVAADTVVIGRVGFYCGSVHYIGEPAWVTDNALIVSYRQVVNKQYLVHLLRYADLRQNDSSTAQPVVSGSKIYPISVKTAPVDEQSEIVRILDSLFAKEHQAKEAAEVVMEKIDLLKKSILARALRGELGTNDPTEESALELLKSLL